MSWNLHPPPDARPPKHARESARAYSQRLKNVQVCACVACCAGQPWRERYREWRKASMRALLNERVSDWAKL